VPNRQSYRSSNIFDSIYQRLDRLSLFVFRHIVPLLLLPKPFPDVFFSKAERRDGSPGILFRFPLQLFRRIREKAKENRITNSDNDAAHLVSLIDD